MSTPPSSPVDWGDVPPAHGGRVDRPGRALRPPRRPADVWVVLRVLVLAFGLFTLVYWGYISWPFPSPALLFMVGAPLFAALVWFFFRSPSSPITTDAVGKAIVEIALMVAVAAAWVSIGLPWVGFVFIVVAGTTGVIAFRRETP